MTPSDAPQDEAESPEALTRRLWLRTIGETAATLSLFEQFPILAQTEPQHSAGTLPPGLYEPSRDHLSHAMMQQSRFHSIPPGCPTDYIRPATGPFVAQFFTPEEFKVIHAITSVFLGAVPSESAVVDEVAQWIDLSIYSAQGVRQAASHLNPSHVTLIRAFVAGGRGEDDPTKPSADPQKICRDGLRWIAEQANARFQKPFPALSTEEQAHILNAASRDVPDFFRLIKGETIRGFYTSEVGLKEIDYKGNGYYAKSPGCK